MLLNKGFCDSDILNEDIQIVGINCLTINGILNNQKFQTK